MALAALSALAAGGCLAEEDGGWDVGDEAEEVSATNLGGANLGGANLGGANLGGANLGGANLGGVNLGGANLAAANLGGANLGGNNLGGANLGGANLGGANLGGANLAGANLAGSTLATSSLSGSNVAGAYAGMGCPVAGTVRLGTDLAATTVGTDIHNLGAASKKMLRSGEDAFARTKACVVLGLGSVALPRLISQNAADATLHAAVGKTSWGIAKTAGGPITLSAWEVVVWGTTRYSVFIVLAPPATDYAGVTGFVKAVWRWAAPPSKTLKIGQIGGGQAIQSYTGMMGAGTHVLAGTISQRTYVAGELSFITATTNNVSVKVDFSAAVTRTNGQALILGNIEGAPPYFEGAYVAVEDAATGEVRIVINSRNSQVARADNTVVVDSLLEIGRAIEAFPDTPPVPRRCAGWKVLEWWGVAPPAGKCDDGVTLESTFSVTLDTSSWAPILLAAGKPVVLPYNHMMMPATEFAGGLAVTYIALNEPGYDIPGRANWVFDSVYMGQRPGTSCTAANAQVHVASHVAQPAVGDWTGIFKVTAADTAPLVRSFTSSCGPSTGPTAVQRQACVLNVTPAQISDAASYEVRLFSRGVRVARSPLAREGWQFMGTCF